MDPFRHINSSIFSPTYPTFPTSISLIFFPNMSMNTNINPFYPTLLISHPPHFPPLDKFPPPPNVHSSSLISPPPILTSFFIHSKHIAGIFDYFYHYQSTTILQSSPLPGCHRSHKFQYHCCCA